LLAAQKSEEMNQITVQDRENKKASAILNTTEADMFSE
jgi:hypothetical protein